MELWASKFMAPITRMKFAVACVLVGAIIFAAVYTGNRYFIIPQLFASSALLNLIDKYRTIFSIKSKPLLLIWIAWIASFFIWISTSWGWFLW
jgi:hypothetical protein